MVMFVNYNDTSKGWWFRKPSTDTILESFDVIFDEVTNYSSSSFTKNQANTVDIPISLLSSSEAHHSTGPMVSNTIIHTTSLPILLSPPNALVGDSVADNSIPPLEEDDDNDISMFQKEHYIR